MSHEQGLLRAILSDPADDGPRLVYADWLDEHEQPERAEFIRVQCELAKRTGAGIAETVAAGIVTTQRRIETLRRREGELLASHGEEWSRPLATMLRCAADPHPSVIEPGGWAASLSESERWQFRRGLVAALTLSAAGWLAHADAVYWHPEQGRPVPPSAQPLERVWLTTWPTLEDHALRRWQAVTSDDWVGRQWSDVFATEWPHVEFELPPQWRYPAPGESRPFVPVGTGQVTLAPPSPR